MSDIEEDSSSSETNWPVNEEWIRKVLQGRHNDEADHINIVDYSCKPGCHKDVSNMSELLAVSVIYELNKSDSQRCIDLIIKLLPNDPYSRYFVTEAQFDLREIKFYTQILPDLLRFQKENLLPNTAPMNVSVPKCFYTQYTAGKLPTSDDMSPEAPESILVLEDMRPLGYRAAHFKEGITLSEAGSAISTIAVVHALSLGIKIKQKLDLNERYPYLFQISKATDSYQQLVEQGIPQLSKFLERLAGHKAELTALLDIRHRTHSVIQHLLQPVEPMGVITHTDFWCNNLLLRETIEPESDDNCVILDWQMVTYSRPTNDIALLIISSVPSAVRRESTGKLLNLYYSSLQTNLANIGIDLDADLGYTRVHLEQDYRKSLLLALLLCIGSVDIALGNQEAEQRFLDVLHDLYEDGILDVDQLPI